MSDEKWRVFTTMANPVGASMLARVAREYWAGHGENFEVKAEGCKVLVRPIGCGGVSLSGKRGALKAFALTAKAFQREILPMLDLMFAADESGRLRREILKLIQKHEGD